MNFNLWDQTTDSASAIGTKRVMTLLGNGNVGIGTAAPIGKLNVSSPTTGEQNIYITKSDRRTPSENGGALYFDNNHLHDTGRAADVVSGSIVFRFSQPTSGVPQVGAVIQAIADAVQGGASAPTALIFSTGNSGAIRTYEDHLKRRH